MRKKTRHNGQRGFTVLELAIVMVVSSLLLIPLLKLAFTAVGGNRDQQTEAAFEEAVDALIAYADDNNGCLPFAADSEGGLPDTDAAGDPLTDTGIAVVDQRAGDLPWADLGLTSNFRDGDFLRIQYYVAFNYADSGGSCGAGFRGREWNPRLEYVGTDLSPIYVYVSAAQKPKLYKIFGTLAPGRHPRDGEKSDPEVVQRVSKGIKKDLLRLWRGPDLTLDVDGQKDHISPQNVFVLIAVGDNFNTTLNRRYFRDANHLYNKDDPWNLGETQLDKATFSMTNDVSSADPLEHGDDTLRVMSFLEFKWRLKAFGMILQPVCESKDDLVDCKE